eukprot:TRINITY_DN6947_c0_g1_i2.p1 TRINITY_DN6947_c0_g1~~TRINITY_DN6947_c0_g1_i2.p1  ORF type:complete len:306 (-),score=33.29 TRINITY_DN6947_c0_g1_i2:156-1073(-)
MGTCLRTAKGPQDGTTTECGNGLKAVCTHFQGRRPTMEDEHCGRFNIGPLSDMALFGIFDGHGGLLAARHTATRLPDVVADCLQSVPSDVGTEQLSAVLKQASFSMDAEIGNLASVKRGRDRSGTTAVFGLITKSHVIVANVGDSRAILWSQEKAIPLSFDHKPTNPAEIARITKAGATVVAGRVNGDLAVSRALGDFRFKTATRLPPERQPVSPEPDIEVYERTSTDEFILFACDGIWDVMTNQAVGQHLHDSMQHSTPEDSCDLLVQECLRRQSRDNMSVLLVLLKPEVRQALSPANERDSRD